MDRRSSFNQQKKSLSIVLPPLVRDIPARIPEDSTDRPSTFSGPSPVADYWRRRSWAEDLVSGDVDTADNSMDCGFRQERRSTAFGFIPSTNCTSPFDEDSDARNTSLASQLDGYRKRRLTADDCDEAFLAGARKVVRFMHCLWVEQEMCDLVLCTDNGDILAHQVVVAAYSPTLADLLRQNQKGSIQQVVQVNLSDFPRDIVGCIVNFFYTTDIELDCRKIAPIICCARQMDIPIIVNICQDYLMDNCDPSNIILHYSIAANNKLGDIQNRLLKVICLAFSEVYRTKHFVYLPISRFVSILTNDSLCCPEIDVFLAIVRWIDHDRCDRLQYAKQLLTLVRYQLIDPDLLSSQVQTVEWIFTDKESLDAVLDAYKFHALHCTRSPALSRMDTQAERCCLSRMQRKTPPCSPCSPCSPRSPCRGPFSFARSRYAPYSR